MARPSKTVQSAIAPPEIPDSGVWLAFRLFSRTSWPFLALCVRLSGSSSCVGLCFWLKLTSSLALVQQQQCRRIIHYFSSSFTVSLWQMTGLLWRLGALLWRRYRRPLRRCDIWRRIASLVWAREPSGSGFFIPPFNAWTGIFPAPGNSRKFLNLVVGWREGKYWY